MSGSKKNSKQKELFLQEMEIRLQNVAMFQGSRKIEINVIWTTFSSENHINSQDFSFIITLLTITIAITIVINILFYRHKINTWLIPMCPLISVLNPLTPPPPPGSLPCVILPSPQIVKHQYLKIIDPSILFVADAPNLTLNGKMNEKMILFILYLMHVPASRRTLLMCKDWRKRSF